MNKGDESKSVKRKHDLYIMLLVSNTLLVCCSEKKGEYLERVVCTHKLLPKARVGPHASSTCIHDPCNQPQMMLAEIEVQ